MVQAFFMTLFSLEDLSMFFVTVSGLDLVEMTVDGRRGTEVRELEGVSLQGEGDTVRCIFVGVLLLTDVQCTTATVYKGAEEVDKTRN